MSKDYVVDVEAKTCVTPEIRGSYVGIVEPNEYKDEKTGEVSLTYGMQAIMPKNPITEAFLKEMNVLMGRVLVDKLGAEKAKKVQPYIRVPFRDGDDPGQVIKLKNADQLAGSVFFSCSNKFKRPVIIGPNGRAVPDNLITPEDFYSGAWYRLMCNFAYYDRKQMGIACYVNSIMKVRDDTRLDNVVSESEATSAFAAFASADVETMLGVEVEGGDDSAPVEEEDTGFKFM